MDRIAETFLAAKAKGRALFVAYICGGDPSPEASLDVARALFANGTDLLEIGVPFSDPLADGLTNQLAAQRALEAGMTQEKVFALVRALRAETEKPIIFYTYYNLVYSQGVDAYVRRAKEAGVDGILTLDLPPEEAGEMMEACARHGLKTVFIVAPTTPPERLPIIAGAATGFIYYVSQEGVTGVRESLAVDLEEAVGRIREATDLPVVVGFGISKPAQVETVGRLADGVVVGSALVNCIAARADDPAAAVRAIGEKAAELSAPLRV
ncbi:MAG: tryptophan synthase subunit alpha [Opitutales bacterium]|nr:tryptophan synthase subunit alpha [Opitutales bacterium]